MSNYVSGRTGQVQADEVGGRPIRTRERGRSSADSSVYNSSAEDSIRGLEASHLSMNIASEEYFEHSCDPCDSAGEHIEAVGYCTKCEDYMCQSCYKSHSRNRATLDHVLLDKDKMPKKYQVCDPCKRAGDDEEAVGYCEDCGEFMCKHCYRSHSRNKVTSQHKLLDKNNFTSTQFPNLGRSNVCKTDPEEYKYTEDINVESPEDNLDCYITGMALVGKNELVLADELNETLKLVDLEKKELKDRLKLETFPVGITAISKDEVAVVLKGKSKIQIVSVSGGLKMERTLKTDGISGDVYCVNGKLYVSFKDPVKFEIMQVTGAALRTIHPDKEVLKYCSLPRYIAVDPDETTIYISDPKTNNVISIDVDGNMVCKFQEELGLPHGITISPFRQVYLCSPAEHAIYKMSNDLKEGTIILGEESGLLFPCAMCFNVAKKQLYVSNGSKKAKFKNFIKVFEWK